MEKEAPSALFVFDFDGTLIDTGAEETAHPVFGEMIEQLRAARAAWAISTGRTLFETFEGIQKLGTDCLPDYLMVKERELYKPGSYRHRWLDFGDWNDRCRDDHRRFLRIHRRLFKSLRKIVENHHGAKFIESDVEPPAIIADDEDHMNRVCAQLDETLPATPGLAYQRNSVYLRFSHAAYDKGTVLGELQRLLDIPPGRTLVAGDNYNDLTMLDPGFARFLVCPSNALSAVKAKVTAHEGHVATLPTSRGLVQGVATFAGQIFRER